MRVCIEKGRGEDILEGCYHQILETFEARLNLEMGMGSQKIF